MCDLATQAAGVFQNAATSAQVATQNAGNMAAWHSKALWYQFNNPEGPNTKRARTFDAIAGRVGWTAKGVVYAVLGGSSTTSSRLLIIYFCADC